jgi:hypothetical protein
MSLVLQSSGGGSITIAEPATASNFTQTLPSASGTVQVSGNQPAFLAATFPNAKSANNSTATEIAGYGTTVFDTASCFNATTGRFTPNVAGYYQFTGVLDFGSNGVNASSNVAVSIYRNNILQWTNAVQITSIFYSSISVSTLVFMNGTTDFASIYAFQTTGGTVTGFYPAFTGVLVRAA